MIAAVRASSPLSQYVGEEGSCRVESKLHWQSFNSEAGQALIGVPGSAPELLRRVSHINNAETQSQNATF